MEASAQLSVCYPEVRIHINASYIYSSIVFGQRKTAKMKHAFPLTNDIFFFLIIWL